MNDDAIFDVVDTTAAEPAPPDAPETPETAAPLPPVAVEVVTVEDLLQKLMEASAEAGEEIEEPAEKPEEFEVPIIVDPTEDQTVVLLEEIRHTVDHPFLTTPFEEYTVAEGMMLLALILFFAAFCIKQVKEAFSWL